MLFVSLTLGDKFICTLNITVVFKIKFQNIVWFWFKWGYWQLWLFLSHKCYIVVVKGLNTLIRWSFCSWNRENYKGLKGAFIIYLEGGLWWFPYFFLSFFWSPSWSSQGFFFWPPLKRCWFIKGKYHSPPPSPST